ncbi:16S rRNA (guanine(527)-N(7))-methyltransferase RsmG [Metamycoplasma auris]|uniref:Ribosomal RNA small subunit methyltransferase G n=1 Tax=Metamycoplasma auris TaxID=51363 RepID=A0A2W7HXQ2_9BACT|nr:16S rRNA (guanine(527)-N(7))-methyltransferase RsmG [Metamycoplasma auris]PZV99965.1 16S rRNA m(7)G-527 methyltransferase [Metamycoplasma auris]
MKIIAREEFNKLIQTFLPEVNDVIISNLWDYYILIEEENSKYNLTGFYEQKLIKEGIIESILIFKEINHKILNLSNKEILDIGSGAGFPIIPYFIYNPNFKLTIYEPMQKRVNFLNKVIEKCNLKNIRILKIRAEESTEFEYFDFISAKAVSELKNLVEISHRLGKINSIFCFLKSTNHTQEINNAKWIKNILDIKYQTLDLKQFFSIKNTLVYYSKTKSTPNFIPRKWSTIIKDNLKK